MRKILLSLALFLGLSSQALAADNYAATAGSGLTFGAKDAAGVLYSRFIGCDNTTVSQCWQIDSSGRQLIIITSGSVASGAFASGSIGSGAMVDLGSIADAAATAGSTGTLSAKMRLMTTQLDTIKTSINGSIPAGTAVIGKVSIDQTTPGTTNLVALAANQSVNTAQVNGVTVLTGTGATGTGAQRVTVSTDQATNAGAALKTGGVGVVNGGSDYETVAASQTAQVLGATGATGDYLSHCVLQPTTTGAGTMTILDNATVIFTFTTGTLSNLAPIPIPIGAISVSGAWKVTTGANETATCFGKFT